MIIVIGGGPAGRMVALRLASAGRKVTVIEKRKLGGQCVFDGCMLVCGLNDAARAVSEPRHLKETGIIKGEVTVDYPVLIEKLEETQRKLSHIIEKETELAGVVIETGKTAEVRGKDVFVDGVKREAEAVIIAGGCEPVIPDVPGNTLSGTYNPRTLRTMRRLPKHLVIVGGGISGAEFAYIYASFGVKVTLVVRSALLSVLPETLRKDARVDLKAVDIREHASLERIIGGVAVEGVVVDGETISCDAVLFATGFTPSAPFVSGVERRADGSIVTDENMQTSVKGVYAAGDICGAPYFTPVARLRGFAAADAILGQPRRLNLSQVPFTVVLGRDYTVCPAAEGGGTTKVMPNIAGPGAFWHVLDSSVGHMQLTAGSDGKILGFASSSPSGGLVGTYLGYLVRKGANLHDFSDLLEVHPVSDGLYYLIRFL